MIMDLKSNEEINQKCIEVLTREKDKYKNNFHFDSPMGLINDPNGLSFYNGEYYIFFQWNPYGCEHNYKHWGYTKTKDFKNFKFPTVFISPDEVYDKNGCYSGSSIVKDDNLNFIYTGNVKDMNGNRESYQCLVTLSKNEEIKKLGPIISSIPKGYTAHFRDPYVFKKEGTYYIIIGAQKESLKGTAVMFSSKDFRNWDFLGEIKTEYKNFGYMWECPSLFELGGDDILVFSPQGLEKEEYKYQNIYQSGYIKGKFDYKTLEFNHDDFKELDMGFDFYAPQVFKDEKGRTLLIGWMGLPESEDEHVSSKYGWMHSLTIPRKLELKNGRLYQTPIEEMKNFREEKIVSLKNIETNHLNLDNVKTNSYELVLELNRGESKEFEISFMENSNEYTLLKYNFDNGVFIIERFNNNLNKREERKFKLYVKNTLKLNMFVDKSAVEIYIQDGMEVVSLRVYNKEEGTGLNIKTKDSKLKIDSINIWKMGEIKYYE